MLVLARLKDEKIMIGDEICITVTEFDKRHGRTRVKLGIEAPQHVPVHRMEVYKAIKERDDDRH